jgi:hypothetical protein
MLRPLVRTTSSSADGDSWPIREPAAELAGPAEATGGGNNQSGVSPTVLLVIAVGLILVYLVILFLLFP